MKRRSRELSVFSMSTIDLFACATGAFILLTLILLPYYLNVDREVVDELRRELAASEARVETVSEARDAALAERDDARSESASCDADLAAGARANAALRDELARSEADLRAELREAAAENAALTASGEELVASNAALRAAAAAAAAPDVSDVEVRAAADGCSDVQRKSFVLVLMSWDTTDDVDLHVVDPGGRRYFYAERRHAGSIASFEEDSIRGPGNEIWMHPEAEPGEYAITFNFFRRRQDGDVTVRGAVFHQRGRTELPATVLTRAIGDRHEEAPTVATLSIDGEGRVTLR